MLESELEKILADEYTDIDDLVKLAEVDEKVIEKYLDKIKEMIMSLDISLEEIRNTIIFCGQSRAFRMVETVYEKLLKEDYTNFDLRVAITYGLPIRDRASKDLLNHEPKNEDLTHIMRYWSTMSRRIWDMLKERGLNKEDLVYIKKFTTNSSWIVPSKKPVPQHIIDEALGMLKEIEDKEKEEAEKNAEKEGEEDKNEGEE